MKISPANSLLAEAYAMYEGILLAQNMGLQELEIQVEAGQTNCNSLTLPIVEKCRLLLPNLKSQQSLILGGKKIK